MNWAENIQFQAQMAVLMAQVQAVRATKGRGRKKTQAIVELLIAFLLNHKIPVPQLLEDCGNGKVKLDKDVMKSFTDAIDEWLDREKESERQQRSVEE